MLKKAFAIVKWVVIGSAMMLAMIGLHTVNFPQSGIHILAAILIGSLIMAALSLLADASLSKWEAPYLLGFLSTFTLVNLNTDGRNIGLAFLAVWLLMVVWRFSSPFSAWLEKKDKEALKEFLQSSSATNK